MWIDERGRIVRPNEDIGSAMIGPGSDFSNPEFSKVFQPGRYDRDAGRLLPEGIAAINAARRPLLDALRDWVEKGSASRYVLAADKAQAGMRLPTPAEEEAALLFRLGIYLSERGDSAAAQPVFQRAAELWPDCISILRNWGDVEVPGNMGGERFFKKIAEVRARQAS
jgi:hypothetical protein